ncbi:hypothetical protein [Novosphingobium album (ex Liu et al. 2023)]|uniref:Argininosuccinate lyase n=1 Tax=Novosphingobium album (ex Liu et al. 2023) TaxID=3031130 RepID=A0ABT5WXF2_9SPHN|nr:hypothetical protein [Novosphingobium album (ex Liu et al. 2023)]MDE8654580.1 hypothetical protein [Novosphingobium album (ex Liu et al. 2023)]
MAVAFTLNTTPKLLLAAAGVIALAGCGSKSEPTYAVDATDASGGELIVTDPSEPGVDVNLPKTPMTNVPPATASAAPGE